VAASLQAKEDQAKVRGKPEKFADHYTQATLFYESQTPVEQAHIAAAFRFELSKVTVPAIRERMVGSLRNASEALAREVADGLGMETLPAALPRALAKPAKPEVTMSPTLSLLARPGDGSIQGRKVAVLVAPGVAGDSVAQVQAALFAQGAVPRLVAPRIGPVATLEGDTLEADASLENEPGFLFDALVLPDGEQAVAALAGDGHTMEFIKDQYRHGKTLLVLGASRALIDKAGLPATLPGGKADPGLLMADAATASSTIETFMAALAGPRHAARETDPPLV